MLKNSYFKALQVVNIKRHGLINILSGQQGFIASSRPLPSRIVLCQCEWERESHSRAIFAPCPLCAPLFALESNNTRQTSICPSPEKRLTVSAHSRNRECFATPPPTRHGRVSLTHFLKAFELLLIVDSVGSEAALIVFLSNSVVFAFWITHRLCGNGQGGAALFSLSEKWWKERKRKKIWKKDERYCCTINK